MPFPSENSEPVVSPFNDVQNRVRQFNDDEAVWRCFEEKRAPRKELIELLRSLTSPPAFTEDELDRLDWLAAEREARPIRAIGIVISNRQTS
jgi:hypothetical protein